MGRRCGAVLAIALGLAAAGPTGCGGEIEGGTDETGSPISSGGVSAAPRPGFGSGGVPGTGGFAATGGSAGVAGVNATGGVTATGGAPSVAGAAAGTMVTNPGQGGERTGDDFVSDVAVAVHDDVNTILVVTWTQTMAADSTWLEFSFEAGDTRSSRPTGGQPGPHRDVVLGVPGETVVSIRIVNKQGETEYRTGEYQGTTDAVPSRMPRPEVLGYDAALASPERFMFGAVEDSDGGCNNQSCYYHTTFWLYVIDRQGRIVWYYADPASNATSSFQRIARDGEYIWIEKRPFGGRGERGVLKMTLDWSYYEEVPVQGLSDCIDVTDDGSLLYDITPQYELREMTSTGQVRTIWSCPAHFGNNFQCYSNTVNWNPLDDTILLSFPYPGTVIEIDRQSGDVVGQYGAAPGSYSFSPSSWGFGFQHFANITPDGTLLVSSHMPGYETTDRPVAGQHAFMEFTIDRQNRTLIEKWYYNEGPEWAMYKGMAIRLANGNTLANYGTGGVIREITPDKQTAFHVKFDSERGEDFFNKMVGHNVLVDDLYSLNGGPE